MILKALTTIILDSSDGSIEVGASEFFRTESSAAISGGYATTLSPEDNKEVLAEYIDYAKKLFGIKA